MTELEKCPAGECDDCLKRTAVYGHTAGGTIRKVYCRHRFGDGISDSRNYTLPITIVTKDIPVYSLAVENPCCVIRKINGD